MNQAVIHLNEPLSPPRIGGIAAAMAIHVAAMMMLMAPLSYAPPVSEPEQITVITDFDPPKDFPIPKPPTDKPKPITKPTPAPIVPKQDVIKTDPPPLVVNNGSEIDYPVGPTQTADETKPFVPSNEPISLSTEYAPAPKYPALSLRNGEQGTVLLLVMVGADGRPIEVTLKKSSGFRELDRNAIKHVLATWRFHPAMHDGIAIPALALVPVNYTLN